MIKQIVTLTLALLLLPGCVTRTHDRPVKVAGQLAVESFKVKTFMTDSSASQISGELIDKKSKYHYKVNATDLSLLSDEEFAKVIAEAVEEALSKIPSTP